MASELLGLVDKTTATMAMGKQRDILVMDFSKVFSKVRMPSALSLSGHKLEHYGHIVKDDTWIQSFPDCHKQTTVVEVPPWDLSP